MGRHDFENYVRSIYPNMIVEFWYKHGELLFYKDEVHSETSEPYSCTHTNGRFEIATEF